METVVLRMLFIVGLSVSETQIGKYVYVQDALSWPEAQKHCTDRFTDLTPVTDQWEKKRLKNATIGEVEGEFWIGLYFNGKYWMLSGGGRATDIPWNNNKDSNFLDEEAVHACWYKCSFPGLYLAPLSKRLPFVCINLVVKKSTATWEQALQHCREQHTDLTSLTSKAEHLLALREIQPNKGDITERVWIGLRYLGDGWLWVNDDTLRYEAWNQEGDQDHLCPLERRCGALTKQGVWENWDCEDRLNFICY